MIYLIGGSGFIGSRLARRLQSNAASFRIIDINENQEFKSIFTNVDISLFDQILEGVPDASVLINLAAQHRDDVTPKSLYDTVNVDGARNVCEVARQRNVQKLIFISSVAVYGFSEDDTDESGKIRPFNDYGRTKFEAEEIYRSWYDEDPVNRTLVIIRPTVVFGEDNRGNVFSLMQQIASRNFIMVGPGNNRKSMAYVENVAAFIEHCLTFDQGIHIYNYVDKPDFTMNDLISKIKSSIGKNPKINLRIPLWLGRLIGILFDVVATISGRKFDISSVRIKKFTSDTIFSSSASNTGFKPPVSLDVALERTIRHEFL